MHLPPKFISYCSRALLVTVALLALAACGKKGPLDGTYASKDATWKFSGDTVTVTRNGAAGGAQMKYVVDGKKITYSAGTYRYEGMINDDGSLTMDKEKLVKK